MPIQRPSWLPSYVPELDGLRGLAILGVFFYHCHPRLQGTRLYSGSLWGWSAVSVFFTLSGFLITANLLVARDRPRYFHNFHARRALRIWPVYILLLLVVYLNAPWFIGPSVWDAIRTAPWLAYIFFVQNLFHFALPPAIGPTWALAIEEQYYFVWAPLVRWLRRPWMLASVLIAALVASPLLRSTHLRWLTPSHTLTHLDGIALGSLLAIAIHTLPLGRGFWRNAGLAAIPIGLVASRLVPGAFLDSSLVLAFAGAMMAAIATTGHPLSLLLRRGPLAYYGRISYGLYMCHIAVFVFFGAFDLKMDPYGTADNLAVVGFRLAVSTIVATVLWYGFESQMLKLKKYF